MEVLKGIGKVQCKSDGSETRDKSAGIGPGKAPSGATLERGKPESDRFVLHLAVS